jgi:PAS domain S-box-containing protein
MTLHCSHCGSASSHSRQDLLGDWVVCPDCYRYFSWREARPYDPMNALAQAVHGMPLGVAVTDAEGRVTYTNPALAAMHGYRVDELRGKNLSVLAPGNHRATPTIQQLAVTPLWKRASVHVRKDGTTFPVELISELVRNPQGRPIAVITTCQDISERKRMDEGAPAYAVARAG